MSRNNSPLIKPDIGKGSSIATYQHSPDERRRKFHELEGFLVEKIY
jgi:hypothetical protein